MKKSNGGKSIAKIAFTARQIEIISLIKQGLPSKQIADKLNISLYTVNRHRQNMMEKAGVNSCTELACKFTDIQ